MYISKAVIVLCCLSVTDRSKFVPPILLWDLGDNGARLRIVLRSRCCLITFCLGFQLKLPQIQKIMMEFEKQSEMMDMKEEIIGDTIDDALGDEDDEEET